jgi:photosystem II stability/assembly factor-like uncharacterized protein
VEAVAARLYVSRNAGETWTSIDLPDGVAPGTLVTALAVHPSNSAVLFMAMQTAPRTESTAGGGSAGNIRDAHILRSSDSGRTWQTLYVRHGEPEGSVERGAIHIAEIVIDPLTPTTIYAATNTGLLVSVDDGETWATLGDSPQMSVATLVVTPTQPAIVYAGVANFGHRFCTRSGGVYRSVDEGRTWEAADTGLPRQVCNIPGQGAQPLSDAVGVDHLVLVPGTPSTLYAVTGDLFMSTDGGEQWTAVVLPDSSMWVWTLAAR